MVDLRETKDLYNELGGLIGISALKNITVSLDRVVVSTSINIVTSSIRLFMQPILSPYEKQNAN